MQKLMEKRDFDMEKVARENQIKREAKAKRNKVTDELEIDLVEKAQEIAKNHNMMEQFIRDQEKEKIMYGHQSKYIKRLGQLDSQTTNNGNYHKSLAHHKYVYKG